MTWNMAPNQAIDWETEALEKGAGPWDGSKAGWDKSRGVQWVWQELRDLGAQT